MAPPTSYDGAEATSLTSLAHDGSTMQDWYHDDLDGYLDSNNWLYQTLVAPRVYPLHPSVLDIDEVKFLVQPWRLTKVSVSKWQSNPRWEQVVGWPTEYCTDYQNNMLALNFRTSNIDTLCLTVRRMPLADLTEDTDVPEIRNHYHDFMLNGILEHMYSKQDSETIDLKKADAYAAAFKRDVDEVKQQEYILDQRLKPNNSLPAFR